MWTFLAYAPALLLMAYTLTFGRNEYVSNLLRATLTDKSAKSHKSVGFILAHPDDESMFFTPTIKYIKNFQSKHPELIGKIHILSLSNGNLFGMGKERELEMRNLCEKYDFECVILDVPEFKDGDYHWDLNRAKEYILKFVHDKKLSLVLTFDEYGVSSHPNHVSVHNAMREVKIDIPQLNVWCLYTLSLPNKYSGLLSLWNCLITDISISSFATADVLKNMLIHRSQFKWYHYLWSIASSYSFINTFYELEIDAHKQFNTDHTQNEIRNKSNIQEL